MGVNHAHFFATPPSLFSSITFYSMVPIRRAPLVFFFRMTCMLVSFTTHTTHNSPEIYLFSATTGDNEESKIIEFG